MKKEEIELVKAVHKAKTKSTKLFEDQGAVTVFKDSSKGMGKLKFHPHEAYEEELEERIN
jgi:hypothetical protein